MQVSEIPTGISGNHSLDGQRGQAPVTRAKVSEIPLTRLDDDAMDTSETPTGRRERAPVEGVMGSGIPTQSANRKSRSGDLRLAIVTGKEVAKGHAQCRRTEMKDKIDTQTRMDPGASFFLDGGGPALSTWVAEERDRILGQELTEAEERVRADLAQKAKVRELEAWGQYKVSPPGEMGAQSKDLADTLWVLTWKEVDGVKKVKARLVAKGYQDPDLREGNAELAGCLSRRSSHSQLISLEALKKWPPWSLGTKVAFPQTDGFHASGILRKLAAFGN